MKRQITISDIEITAGMAHDILKVVAKWSGVEVPSGAELTMWREHTNSRELLATIQGDADLFCNIEYEEEL